VFPVGTNLRFFPKYYGRAGVYRTTHVGSTRLKSYDKLLILTKIESIAMNDQHFITVTSKTVNRVLILNRMQYFFRWDQMEDKTVHGK
jgi:hypothetical protein